MKPGLIASSALLIAALPLCAGAQPGGAAGLNDAAVFAMSNARAGNTVVAYRRNTDGSLDEAGRFDTGGTGSGSFEDTANGLVLATLEGEISPNNLVEPGQSQQFLLVTNAGSNNISVFAVGENGLELRDLESSVGEKPVSITVNRGRVFVLNSGETNDDLFDGNGDIIANCTTGQLPSIAGFTLDASGNLEPVRGSTRRLSGEAVSGCAQLSFDPSGRFLIATERLATPRQLDQQTSDEERLDDEGVISIFRVDSNGRPSLFDATGQGPFGFGLSRSGLLFTTEQFDGPDGIGRGAASSYVLSMSNQGNARPELLRSSPSIGNGGTDTCWFVVSDDQRLGFVTSFFEDGRISSYALDELGIVRLIQAVASGENAVDDNVAIGASDLALSRNSEFLYQLNSLDGSVSAFHNNGDGTLSFIEKLTPFPQPPFGPGAGQAAPLGLAAS